MAAPGETMQAQSRRRRKVVPPNQIEVECEGRIWAGHYTISAGKIDVWCEFGRKETQLGVLSEAELAKMLLREIVQDRVRGG
jgi:hypothetical protein